MATAVGYLVLLTDPVLVASLQAQYPTGIQIPPRQASTVYNAPISYADSNPNGPGQAPTIIIDGGTFAGSGNLIDNYSAYYNSQTFTVPAQTFSHDHQPNPIDCYWVGNFAFAAAGAGSSDPTPEPAPILLGARRWINGFEIPDGGDGSSGSLSTAIARDASRTTDGFGVAQRSIPANTQIGMTHPTGTIAWTERLYIRIRTVPVGGEDCFWTTLGSVVGAAAAVMTVNGAGVVKFYSRGLTAYPGTLVGQTASLTVGTWYRIDLAMQYASGAFPNIIAGSAAMYLNGTQVFALAIGAPDGLSAVQLTSQSRIGTDSAAGATHGLEIDIDDWIGCNSLGVPSAPLATTIGNPLLIGSHIRQVPATGFAAGHQTAAWTGGGWQSQLGIPPKNSSNTMGLITTTPNAVAQLATNYTPRGNYGAVAMIANGWMWANLSSVNDTLSLLGQSKQASAGALTWMFSSPVLYSVPDSTDITAVPVLSNPTIQFQRGNSAITITIGGMMAAAEELGNFGAEDTTTVAPARTFGLHNASYPSLAQQFAPISGIQIQAFTYVGNGTAQDIPLAIVPNWVFLRRADNTGFGWWWTSMDSAHQLVSQSNISSTLPNVNIVGALPGDGIGTATLHLGSNDTNSNVAAAVYEVVAVADVGMRYMLNGQFAHLSGAATFDNNFVDATFTPDAAFFHIEAIGGSGTIGAYYKGPGYGAGQGSPLNATQSGTVANFAAGKITSLASLNQAVPATAFSAWRKSDGSGQTFFDCGSYVGNASGANRTIPVVLNGMSPLWAIVVPHTAAAVIRDPSHTGVNSQIWGAGNTTTGIVGGDVNAIVVNNTLNAGGVTYDFFVIQGCQAVIGGWSPNCTFEPVNWVPRPSAGPFPAPPAPAPPLDAGCISFGQAVTELLYRLEDFGGTHWTVAECQRYLLESLRIWNAITNLSRARGTFSAASPNVFYDLPTVLKDQATGLINLRGYNLKDQDLMLDLQYQLQEPPDATGWSGTVMFSQAQITAVMQRRRDQFLWETGQVVTREVTTPTPDGNGRVALSADIIDVRRAAWNSHPLLRDNEWGMNAYKRTWPTPVAASTVNPFAYSVSVTPPITAQLVPPPTGAGTLDTISLVTGSTLNPINGVLLGVPDDFAWVTKWGTIRDLFDAPGPANDPARSKIANDMWTLGITLAKIMGVVLDTFVAGIPVRNVGIASADRYLRTWQTTTGTPSRCVIAGSNLVAFAPPPNAGPYTIVMDVVRNQPVPVAFTDCFYEGGVAQTAALLDYAEFLARYKEGPEQAQQAVALLQRFLVATGVAQAMDQARAMTGRKPLLDEARRGEVQVPRQEPISGRSPVEGG